MPENTSHSDRPAGVFDRQGQMEAPVVPDHMKRADAMSIPEKGRIESEDRPVMQNKPNFVSPEREAARMISQSQEKSKTRAAKISKEEQAIAATQNALNQDGAASIDQELEELDKISPEDLKLAEELIFRGYAELDVPMDNIPNIVYTICSTSADDMSMIDEIIYDYVRQNTNDKGDIVLPQSHVESLKNALYVALSCRGVNKQEFCDIATQHLNTIKTAIKKMSEMMAAGELEKAKNLGNELKKSIMARAIRVKRMPTPVIDFISGKKYNFDSRMFRVMNQKGIVPKS